MDPVEKYRVLSPSWNTKIGYSAYKSMAPVSTLSQMNWLLCLQEYGTCVYNKPDELVTLLTRIWHLCLH
jgi:hypothetical protein